MASSSLVVRTSVPKEIMRGQISEVLIRSCSGPVVSRCVAPWLMLLPEFKEDSTVFKFYRLAEGDVIQVQHEQQVMMPDIDSVCLGSLSKGWLVCIQPKDCLLFMFNPLSGKTIQLPSIETFPCVNGVIRNSVRVECFLNHQSIPLTPQRMSSYIVEKMILSSPDPMEEDCIALVIYGPHQRLAFCRRPGIAEANSWTALDGPLREYTQIVFHSGKKLFFALTQDKELEAWDLHNDPTKRFLIQIEDIGCSDDWPSSAADDTELECKSCYCWDTDYLVYDHQSQELFVVTRYIAHGIAQDGTLILPVENAEREYPYKTQTFDVFKLDFIDHDRVELQYLPGSLGNRAFFIGSNPGFALSTTMFPELRPNSIYFTDDLTYAYIFREEPNCGGHDLGIYDCKEGSFLSCYYPVDVDKIQRILPAPIWFTPDVDATCLASTLGTQRAIKAHAEVERTCR
ncbi:uncharacterized protein [Nicotiana tomentosiformis]|uniref:KIB1-4 beta-propeller domain-containing protein n=1 Tax=Nicotiana tabacum TaxID=4097 RepID=A0A1S4A8P1_TOBAC|nr:uncharacterized protein LOC104099739 [Nicotiana tomentosiformis]XP_016473008.1 PREDICTED: uncharacterized protein LOC107794966 [Nicotiana tabacum]